MINFKKLSKQAPYVIFNDKYILARSAKQKNIEAACISSYSSISKEVTARYVNIKFINNKDLIFFSNYSSQKAKDFLIHDQITCLFFWNKINLQIRIKAKIKKTSKKFNQEYFSNRDPKKNALAIASRQSDSIESYNELKESYYESLNSADLTTCPDYWGGYSLTPYYFEFWEGHQSRLNRRETFDLQDGQWIRNFLQA